MSLGATIDRALSVLAPQWAARRAAARTRFGLLARAYEAGVQDRLTARSRRTESIVQAMKRTLAVTRAQARDLYRYNPHAHGLVDSTVAFVVGCGIRPQARVLRPRKLDGNETFNDAADTAWQRWAYEEDYYKKQRMVLREKIVAGECLIRKSAPRGRSVPLALEVIKSERLALLDMAPRRGDNRIVQGIEFDASGKRVAYHIYPVDPTDNTVSFAVKPDRVPADEIIHVYDQLEPGQIRGMTRFMPCAGTLENLAQYQDFVMTKERTATAFALMITQNNLGISETKVEGGAQDDPDGNMLASVEGGMFWHGRNGEALSGVSSGVQPAAVDQLTAIFLRQIARGFNSSYELISRDLSNVSYLSARQGENHDRRHWEPEQGDLNRDLNEPIWREFIRMGALAGVIPVPDGADFESYSAVEWVTDGWDWIDPSKDVMGDIEAIKAGQISPQEAAAKHGRDWFRVLTDTAAHKREADALGLKLTIYPDAIAEAEAAAQPEPEPQAPPGAEDNDNEANATEAA